LDSHHLEECSYRRRTSECDLSWLWLFWHSFPRFGFNLLDDWVCHEEYQGHLAVSLVLPFSPFKRATFISKLLILLFELFYDMVLNFNYIWGTTNLSTYLSRCFRSRMSAFRCDTSPLYTSIHIFMLDTTTIYNFITLGWFKSISTRYWACSLESTNRGILDVVNLFLIDRMVFGIDLCSRSWLWVLQSFLSF